MPLLYGRRKDKYMVGAEGLLHSCSTKTKVFVPAKQGKLALPLAMLDPRFDPQHAPHTNDQTSWSFVCGGRYRTRTYDPLGVNEML